MVQYKALQCLIGTCRYIKINCVHQTKGVKSHLIYHRCNARQIHIIIMDAHTLPTKL